MMKEKLQNIKEEALKAIEAADMPEKLNDVRVKFLGKKGELTAVLKGMKAVSYTHLYESVVEIDLSEVRPTVAFPHLPGNAKTIDEIEAMEPIKIDQVVIGSCTNGRMEDMRKAAAILQGHTVHPDVRVMVVPATQKIYKQCIRAVSYTHLDVYKRQV